MGNGESCWTRDRYVNGIRLGRTTIQRVHCENRDGLLPNTGGTQLFGQLDHNARIRTALRHPQPGCRIAHRNRVHGLHGPGRQDQLAQASVTHRLAQALSQLQKVRQDAVLFAVERVCEERTQRVLLPMRGQPHSGLR